MYNNYYTQVYNLLNIIIEKKKYLYGRKQTHKPIKLPYHYYTNYQNKY